jgi:hypothetical protein
MAAGEHANPVKSQPSQGLRSLTCGAVYYFPPIVCPEAAPVVIALLVIPYAPNLQGPVVGGRPSNPVSVVLVFAPCSARVRCRPCRTDAIIGRKVLRGAVSPVVAGRLPNGS